MRIKMGSSLPGPSLSLAHHTFATIAERSGFDTLIDARAPSEFALDHIPGAINCPVLNDAERAQVGTLYKQVSPFAARKLGAVLVARNIAQHVETLWSEQPRSWKPLVYCWRGGQRSGAFTHVLREIGWGAMRLQGGYKSWRQHVIGALQTLPQTFPYRVVAGPTGSGKTRVLEALQRQGEQVLNLEALAAHKGSVLGAMPNQPQPSQKMFETQVYAALAQYDPQRPVYVESESRRIGQLRVPQAVYEGIQAGQWIALEAEVAQRVQFLLRDYDYLLHGPQLAQALERLTELCGRASVARWQAMIAAGDFATLVGELLLQHYDLYYKRSLAQLQSGAAGAGSCVLVADDLSPEGIEALARRIVQLAPAALAA